MKLLNTIDLMDIAFNKAYDEDNVYFRMDSSIIAIESASGKLLWEYAIEYASPVGTHLIWVFDECIVYGAIDRSTGHQVFGLLNKNGEELKVIKTPHRIYNKGINNKEEQTLSFVSLHTEHNTRYYCVFNPQSGAINEIKKIENTVEFPFFENENLLFGGSDGVFLVRQDSIEKVYDKNILHVVHFEDQTWIVEALEDSSMFGIKKWNQTNDLIFSFENEALQKSTFSNIQVFEDKMYITLGDGGGMNCYDLTTGKLRWQFGKDKMTINSYTITQNQVFVVAETLEADLQISIIDAMNGSLIDKVDTDIEPEYITHINDNIYLSGLLGMQVYTLATV
ncbi:outer membrane protein assembly factor BamB family protein [Aureispira anguillae]|uniref:PQQ-binding-like beta-propeller repeat protein n=1 Tax=Aureispira anguillae TaxID=2864201 RepID=A0A915YKJ7_9BACT|nr:PQQ-binding-like beta-propeller repeat protein [Aureispira anguillae]BDS14719.1 PQQ-binding-like beta-propeller repeat protein [Aureispira anguillae]